MTSVFPAKANNLIITSPKNDPDWLNLPSFLSFDFANRTCPIPQVLDLGVINLKIAVFTHKF